MESDDEVIVTQESRQGAKRKGNEKSDKKEAKKSKSANAPKGSQKADMSDTDTSAPSTPRGRERAKEGEPINFAGSSGEKPARENKKKREEKQNIDGLFLFFTLSVNIFI